MTLGEWLSSVGSRPRSDDFEQFSGAVDVEWMNQALSAAGTKSIRKRKLVSRLIGRQNYERSATGCNILKGAVHNIE